MREETLIAKARRKVSTERVVTYAKALGTTEVLEFLRTRRGFQTAFDSWHAALWSWVDQETQRADGDSVSSAQFVRSAQFDWACCPSATPAERRHDEEIARQQMLLDLAVFFAGQRYSPAQDAKWLMTFGNLFYGAAQLGLLPVFTKLVEMKQRKPPKDKGDRQLRFALLCSWIAGGLWVLTTKSVAHFLQEQWPRTQDLPYRNKTISDACRDLGLKRRRKPLYRIVRGQPSRFELTR
jgi:hypothetical protein